MKLGRIGEGELHIAERALVAEAGEPQAEFGAAEQDRGRKQGK